MTAAPWSGIIARLNIPTPEGAILLLDDTIIPTRELPLPLTAICGDEVVRVGTIEQVARDGDGITAHGLIDTKLLSLLKDRPENLAAVPIAAAVGPTDSEPGWQLRGAHLTRSAWGDTTIKID